MAQEFFNPVPLASIPEELSLVSPEWRIWQFLPLATTASESGAAMSPENP
jgi:hypothetical protein